MPGKHRILVVASAAALWSCTESHDTVDTSGERYANQSSDDSSPNTAPESGNGRTSTGTRASAGTGSETGSGTARAGGAAPSAGNAGNKGTAGSGVRASATDRAPSGAPDSTASGDDIAFKFDVSVPAGAELFRCIYAQIPTDRGVVAVPSVESHYTPGSHHLLTYRSNLTAIPEGKAEPWDCANGAWQLNQRGSYYEAQQPDESRQLPKGIAHKFQPGEVLIMQAHYINTSDQDLAASVQMVLHTMDESKVEQEAGTIYFNNVVINVPPHSSGKAAMNCTLPQDISLASLWSHMHKRGVHFRATTDDAEAVEALGTLYEESDWNEPRPRDYPSDPPVVLHAGTRISFECDYQNDSDKAYRFGTSAEENEMCILHGMYWPRMPSLAEQCLGRAPAAGGAAPAGGDEPEGG